GGYYDDALVVRAVRPVRDTPAGHLARRPRESLALVRPPDPKRLAGRRVDRRDIARDAGRGIKHAVDHQRRRLVLDFGRRPEIAGVPAPRDLEIAYVPRVDLPERRVALRGKIAAVNRPLGHAVRGLRGTARRERERAKKRR